MIELTDHQILMRHHFNRLGFIPNAAAEGATIKKLLQHFTKEDCLAYYDHQCLQLQPHGLRTSVSWLTVQTRIAEWIKAGRPARPIHGIKTQDIARNTEEPEIDFNCRACWDLGEYWGFGKIEQCDCQTEKEPSV
jgi:hypothetical protein